LALGEQVWECGIGILAVVIVLKVLQRRISGVDESVISHHWLRRCGGSHYLSVSLSHTGK
jgi:hypothetical protein